MDPQLPDDIAELAAAARRALSDPGLDRARRAMAGDDSASTEVDSILRQLGLTELDPGEHHQALAAAHLALESGRTGNVVPVAAAFSARSIGRDGLLQAIPARGDRVVVEHGRFAASQGLATGGVTVDGRLVGLALEAHVPEAMLVPFARTARRVGSSADGYAHAFALYETLAAFASLGAAYVACDLARDHLKNRIQFGKPLASQQSLQHRFADMLLAVAGLNELAHYTLWRLYAAPEKAVIDALGLRVQHVEAVRSVFRNGHQIHAAVGFCDEHAMSVASRAVRFAQYLPLTYDETLDALIRHLPDGWDALFDIAPFA
ncbi:MAG: acyl-CoA dehydrogenase family protein [Acidimicrobiia bacterium]